jgi:phosphoglycerate dehydrogenase-like enzyme
MEAIPWPPFSYPTSCRKPPSRSSAIAASKWTFDPKLGKDKEKLLEMIGEYDGLAIRSATKVDRKGHRGGRQSQGDRPRRHRRRQCRHPGRVAKGIIVMNTPFGNSITTAEHAIAMMFAVARQIPEADASTHGRQVGEVEIHGRRDDRQDAGRDRRGQYRLHRLQARSGLNEGAGL